MSNLDNSGMFDQIYRVISQSRHDEQNFLRNRPMLRKCGYCGSNHHSDANCPNCGAPDRSKISHYLHYAY